MEKSIDYFLLVQQAQLGERTSRNRLAEAVRGCLYAYVYRYTLNDDLTNDIVQDSILKMLETIGELRDAAQFWPWLYKVARNKIRLHYRKEQHHKTACVPDMDHYQKHTDSQEVISAIVYKEFKEIVLAAMRELKPKYRSVINMRCYDQMQYSEIAQAIGCSEFGAQKLFFRAKAALKKRLARHGFGKGSLAMALVLFGKLTAPSKAAAAQVTVTAATTKVSIAASAAAIAETKAGVLALTTAGALTVGTIILSSGHEWGGTAYEKMTHPPYSYIASDGDGNRTIAQEYWYYYPEKASSTVMMLAKGENEKGRNAYLQILQNAKGNYCYNKNKGFISINNYRQWRQDLSVWRLPTDPIELTDFLAKIDGKARCVLDVYHSQDGLLLVIKPPGQNGSGPPEVTHHYNIQGEDYFKYDWPTSTEVIDNRDAMHKRGWTYFTVSGQIDGKSVKGAGRIPFVYSAITSYWPWMRLRIGTEIFIDGEFNGLSRPWMGLHAIDTVRRDAAEKKIPFATELGPIDHKARVVLAGKSGKILYTIDMKTDLVEQIVFTGGRKGWLAFTYLQDVGDAENRFAAPKTRHRTYEPFKVLELSDSN